MGTTFLEKVTSSRHPSEAIMMKEGLKKWSEILLKELKRKEKKDHIVITHIHVYFNGNCVANLPHCFRRKYTSSCEDITKKRFLV